MLFKTLKHQLKSHFGTATKHLPTSGKREIKSIQYFKDYEACTAERQPKKMKVNHSDLFDDMIDDMIGFHSNAWEDFVLGYEFIGNHRIEVLIEREVFHDNIHVKIED